MVQRVGAQQAKQCGLFITFEGPEGCGKSTQARRLAASLKKAGHTVLMTREPGGTVIGERIRRLLLDPACEQMIAATELFLYMAARAQLVHEVIEPALRKGSVVICDRFLDATLAYQGYAGSQRLSDILTMGAVATKTIDPHCTILLDIDVKKGLQRLSTKPDRLERKTVSYHKAVRQGYLALAKAYPGRMHVVDADSDKQSIARTIYEIVTHCERPLCR